MVGDEPIRVALARHYARRLTHEQRVRCISVGFKTVAWDFESKRSIVTEGAIPPLGVPLSSSTIDTL